MRSVYKVINLATKRFMLYSNSQSASRKRTKLVPKHFEGM
jgi:hypothetical protein